LKKATSERGGPSSYRGEGRKTFSRPPEQLRWLQKTEKNKRLCLLKYDEKELNQMMLYLHLRGEERVEKADTARGEWTNPLKGKKINLSPSPG